MQVPGPLTEYATEPKLSVRRNRSSIDQTKDLIFPDLDTSSYHIYGNTIRYLPWLKFKVDEGWWGRGEGTLDGACEIRADGILIKGSSNTIKLNAVGFNM